MEDAYIDKQKGWASNTNQAFFHFSLRLLNKKTYFGLFKKYTLKYY